MCGDSDFVCGTCSCICPIDKDTEESSRKREILLIATLLLLWMIIFSGISICVCKHCNEESWTPPLIFIGQVNGALFTLCIKFGNKLPGIYIVLIISCFIFLHIMVCVCVRFCVSTRPNHSVRRHIKHHDPTRFGVRRAFKAIPRTSTDQQTRHSHFTHKATVAMSNMYGSPSRPTGYNIRHASNTRFAFWSPNTYLDRDLSPRPAQLVFGRGRVSSRFPEANSMIFP